MIRLLVFTLVVTGLTASGVNFESMSLLAKSVNAKVLSVENKELPTKARNLSEGPNRSSIVVSEPRSGIQGFLVTEKGVSKIVYIDVSQLGDYRKLSFGDNVDVIPFNDVQIESFNVEEAERKLNNY